MEGRVALFYRKTMQVSSWKIRTKITGSCPCIVLALFELERENNSEKKNSSFLIAKMYDFNFYKQLLARVVRRSRNNLFKQEKVFQISRVILATEQSMKSF